MAKAGKRKQALCDSQLAFGFDPPSMAVEEGALSSLPTLVASAVSRILKEDPRDRYTISGLVSALLDEDVSKLMLDAYASPARDGHNIPFARFLALVQATRRYDVLGALCRQIGATVLVGEEVYLAEIGHLEAEQRRIQQRLRSLKSGVAPMDRGAKGGGARG